MVKSMTGYGRAVETINGREFTVEVRSVNNRYLDCTVKLPRSLTFAEESVKQAVKGAITRGKVDVYITVHSESVADVKITLNTAVVEGYLEAMKQMVETYAVKDDISVSLLSRMNDVFTVERQEVDEEQLLADLLQVVGNALVNYNAMRVTEGAALERDLRSRGNTILELVAQVEAGNSQTVVDYRTRLENKIKEVLANTSIEESRILTEAAIFADKVAVDEETVRLRSHLEQMNQMLTNGGAIGRKLDFLLQEMNRETNTIGSKCSDVRLARVVVDMKAELEKIREQTQNIE
ncbi:MAG: YicC family protein [Oscillospiraceae bacterium]|nr:YicC family protein [Oscillospiraceae bacterium]